MSEKQSRKELLNKNDAFLKVAGKIIAWVQHHRLAVVIPVAAVVVLIAVSWLGMGLVEDYRLDSSQLYKQALDINTAEIASDASKADVASKPPIFASKQDRAKSARAAFQKVIDTSSKSGAALLSRFYIVNLDIELGENERALANITSIIDNLTPDDSLYFLAIERAAHLLEQKGDAVGAVKMWERLNGATKRFYSDHALLQLARLHADKGENDKARNFLARIEKDYSKSSLLPKVQELYAKVGRPETAAASLVESNTSVKKTP